MRLKLLTPILALLIASAASGTPQAPDRLLLDGETYRLNTNPLDSYFEEYPDQHPREAEDGDNVVMSSGLWRGYIATFEVLENTFRIRDFEVYRPSDNREERPQLVSEIDRFFPTTYTRRMDWYSGILVLPTGEVKQYVHLSYASIFDAYILLRIEDGRITDRAEMTGEEFVRFKHKQFELFRESDEYLELVSELRDPEDEEQELDRFIFDYGGFVEHVMLDFDEAKAALRKD